MIDSKEMESAKPCKICGTVLPLSNFNKKPDNLDGRYGKCKSCHRAAQRIYRQSPAGKRTMKRSNSKYAAKNRDKAKAHAVVNNAIKRGRLIRQPCFTCGEGKSEAHHPSYSLPLAVTWLCRKHHQQIHIEHRERETAHD